MQWNSGNFDRVGKWFVDRFGMTPEEAAARLSRVRPVIVCGPEVATSATFQAGLLTLANLIPRVFKAAPSVVLSTGCAEGRMLLPWPAASIAEALRQVCPSVALTDRLPEATKVIALGNAKVLSPGLRVSFDGWSACVAPTAFGRIMAQRDRCVLAGIAGAALGVSELFAEAAGMTVEACQREVGISLWRPDLAFDEADAVGPELAYLPGEGWFLGLGHVGQGCLWALAMLPYARPAAMKLLLQDFDRTEQANIATQILTPAHAVGKRKTEVVAEFLRARSFDPAIVSRRFDAGTKRYSDEPSLAFCCFDGQGPRHLLDGAQFEYVVECGVGGEVDDFDELHLHTLPLGDKAASELWPSEGVSPNNRIAALVRRNAFYESVRDDQHCGELELAGRSIAVPFVGCLAGSLMTAEALRMLHGGSRARFIGMTLSGALSPSVRYVPDGYRGVNRPRLAFPHLEVRS